MASPYKDPRTGILYLRRQIPEPLRGAFGGAALFKQSLRTRDMAEARVAFVTANAELEARFTAERERIAREGDRPSPEARAAALVRRYYEGFASAGGIDGRDRLRLTLVQLDRFADRATGSGMTLEREIELPPPVAIEEWIALEASSETFARFLKSPWYCEHERIGLLWARLRWDAPEESLWRAALRLVTERIVRFAQEPDDVGAIPREAIAGEILARIDVAVPRGFHLSPERAVPRRPNVRLRPGLRLMALFEAWQEAKSPTPQTALEYRRAVEDLIDFTADLKVIDIDADTLFDYRDAAASLPRSMPRADRALAFREQVARHEHAVPKVTPTTLKKRIGGIQALLTFAFQQRWMPHNAGIGIHIEGYRKVARRRRSAQDGELGALYGMPLFVDPASWAATRSSTSDSTLYWLFLIALTTGARLEEVGQCALADVREDGAIVYLDIDRYVIEAEGEDKSLKTEESVRLVPIHDRLIALGFRAYLDALRAADHSQLFPDLVANAMGKRTKEASRRVNRLIDKHLSRDRRLVFHSLRHTLKALGGDAGLSDRVLDQICGHAPVSTGGRYGSEPRIGTIHRELHRIDFGFIDWPAIERGAAAIDWTQTVARLRNQKTPSAKDVA